MFVDWGGHVKGRKMLKEATRTTRPSWIRPLVDYELCSFMNRAYSCGDEGYDSWESQTSDLVATSRMALDPIKQLPNPITHPCSTTKFKGSHALLDSSQIFQNFSRRKDDKFRSH